MLLSESSVQDLSSRVENDLTVERFRPNIVISDCEAFQEVGHLSLFFPLSGTIYSSWSPHRTCWCDSIEKRSESSHIFSLTTHFFPFFSLNPQTPKHLLCRIPGRRSRLAMWGCSAWCHVDGNAPNASDGPRCSDVTACVQMRGFCLLQLCFHHCGPRNWHHQQKRASGNS